MGHWVEGEKALGSRSSMALLSDPDHIHLNFLVTQLPYQL